MSIPILILGKSGTGKTRSTKNFEPGEVEILNCDGKLLSYFDVQHELVDIPQMAMRVQERDGLAAPPLRCDVVRSYLNSHHEHKAVVIDDYGSTLFEIYERFKLSEDEAFDNKFKVFDMITERVARQFRVIQEDGDAQRIAYFIMHTEKNNFGDVTPLVMGKAVNDKLVLEGKVTCTLQSDKVGDRYVFYTNNGNPAKSPEGLFDEVIDNDLKAVDSRIREAYRLGPLEAVGRDD